MSGAWSGLEDAHRDSALPLLRAAANEMRSTLGQLASAITEVIHEACPDLPSQLHDETFASAFANLEAFTAAVRSGSDVTAVDPPRESQEYARTLARGGLDMELLTRAYRHGEHTYRQQWHHQLTVSSTDPDSLAHATQYLDDFLFRFVSSLTRALAVDFAEENERQNSPTVVLRLNEVRKILSGAQIDQVASSQRLRYRLDGWHHGFVLWHEGRASETADSLEELGRLTTASGKALGATNTLALHLGDVYAGWANVAGSLETLDMMYPNGVRIAFGLPYRGPDGFRRTHQEALQARRVADLSGRRETPVSFGDLALDALLTTDVEEARRFVARQLGDLADRSGPRSRIVDTLEAYLLAGSSMARVSRQLGVHENTVAYRIRRAEEILGRRIEEQQLELQAALRLAKLLNPSD